jgi:hypothetical protein
MRCTYTLVDKDGEPVKIEITMPDGRALVMQPIAGRPKP